MRWIKQCDRVERDGIELWSPPALLDGAEQEQYLAGCHAAVVELCAWFDVPPKSRLKVFVFGRGADSVAIFGHDAMASAWSLVNGVVVARDHVQRYARPAEVLRHEIAHLLSYQWGPFESFKGEGLATWLQQDGDGHVDADALTYLLGERCLPIGELLDPRRWNEDRAYSYAIAGSFTGYLLRRFGKATYRTFYRRVVDGTFATTFADVFGASVAAVEREWRADLLGRSATFEPRLSRAVGERRVAGLFERWQLYQCLDEVQGLRNAGRATGRALVIGAYSHWHLGNHAAAAQLLEEALATDRDAPAPHRGEWWLRLGQARDVQQLRLHAVEAYRRAVEEAAGGDDRLSRVAQRYLNEPYRE